MEKSGATKDNPSQSLLILAPKVMELKEPQPTTKAAVSSSSPSFTVPMEKSGATKDNPSQSSLILAPKVMELKEPQPTTKAAISSSSSSFTVVMETTNAKEKDNFQSHGFVAESLICLLEDEWVFKHAVKQGTREKLPKEGDIVNVKVIGYLHADRTRFLDLTQLVFAINGDKLHMHSGPIDCVVLGMILAVMTTRVGDGAWVDVLPYQGYGSEGLNIQEFSVAVPGDARLTYKIEMVSFDPDLIFVDMKKKLRTWRGFYEECDAIRSMRYLDVYMLRRDLGISIEGFGLVKPVKLWKQVLRQYVWKILVI